MPVSGLPSGAASFGSPTPLLEREGDLAALRALVQDAVGGVGRFAVIEGGAGIGKTRLLAEARVIGAAEGARVMSARGGELEQEYAFGIVRQLFEPLLASVSAGERAELLVGAAGLAAPIFDRSTLGEVSAFQGSSFAIMHGLYWLAANAAAVQPTLLVVDDLHWADAPSLRSIAYIVRRLEGLPLLLAVGARPPEQSEHTDLLTELTADPAAVLLRPRALSRESVVRLAENVFTGEPDMQFCAASHEVTGGNPLYLHALLTTLAEEGVAPTTDSAARVREVGPEPVARIVALRLSRLSRQAGALARAIAILGPGPQLGLAAGLAGLDRPEALLASAALVRSELLRVQPAIDFVHPVVRTAIYEAIGPLERGEAHRRAAELLREAGAESEQIASHLLLVAPVADPFAVVALRRAARRAIGRGAADTSVTYLRRALSEPPAPAERGDVLWELGLAESLVDVLAAADHLLEALRTVEDPLRYGERALQCGRVLIFAARHEEAIETLASGAARTVDLNRALGEQLQATLITSAWLAPMHYPKARELLRELREQEPDRFEAPEILTVLAYDGMLRAADRERVISMMESALQLGPLEGAGSLQLYPANVFGFAGDLRSIAITDDIVAAGRQHGDIVTVMAGVTSRAALRTRFGDLLGAEADAQEGLSLAEQVGSPLVVHFAAACLAEVLVERGHHEEAQAAVSRVDLEPGAPDSDHYVLGYVLNARGRIRLAQRRAGEALADFLAQGRIVGALEVENPEPAWYWRSSAAAALHLLGQDGEARKLALEELENARRWGAPRPIGIGLRVLGLIEGGSEGERRLREALDVLAPSAARLDHAKALVDLGAALRRRNERREGRELLRQGVDLARRCGATALVQRANDELAATGARPRKNLVAGRDSLTASERRVAQLAAQDMTNKEIAQALFVTVKTVEVHLSHAYRKLEIASRRQIEAALAE